MGLIHALLAVVPGMKGAADKIMEETKVTFQKKGEHFDGSHRTYRPKDESGEELPEIVKPLVTTVGEKLAHFERVMVPVLDAMFQVDVSNLSAVADISVEGFNGIPGVPATYLMQLDRYLSMIRGVFKKIPTLDPNFDWERSIEGAGIYETAVVEKNRTAKTVQHKTVAPATKEHAAQVVTWNEDRAIGVFREKLHSGRLTPREKSELLFRLDALQVAVKKALSAANATKHAVNKIGAVIFKYLLGDIPLSRGSKQGSDS